jgi:hypothetical protein
MAGSRKVLVLPLDGNAPATQRAKLNASVAKMAKSSIAGDVTIGDTTFNETASAVGCNPEVPACADTVMSTLSVDELVYGTATTADGSTTIIVNRATKGRAPKTHISVISKTDGGEQAESGLAPLFTSSAVTPLDGSGSEGSAVGSGSGSAAARPRPAPNFFDTRERKLGFAFAAGGAAALIAGFWMWASKDSLQDRIDVHPTASLADLRALAVLEDQAGSKAMWGNILVVVGLGLGGTSAYFLWKDRQNRRAGATTVTPAPVEEGTGIKLLVGGRW